MYEIESQQNKSTNYKKIGIALALIGLLLTLGYAFHAGFLADQSDDDGGITISDYQVNAEVADAQVNTTDGRVSNLSITYDDVSATVENIPSGTHDIKFNNTFEGVLIESDGTRIDNSSEQILSIERLDALEGPTPNESVDFANSSNEVETDEFAQGVNFTDEVGSNESVDFEVQVDANFKATVNNGSDSALLTDPIRPILTVSSEAVVIAEFTISGQLNAEAPSGN